METSLPFAWRDSVAVVVAVRGATIGQLPALTSWARVAARSVPGGVFLLLPLAYINARNRDVPGVVRGMVSDPGAVRGLYPAASELAVIDASKLPELVPGVGIIEVEKPLFDEVTQHMAVVPAVGADGVWRVTRAALQAHIRSWWRAEGPGPSQHDVAALAAAQAGDGPSPVEYMDIDATGGLADPRRGGLKWGFETEFRFPKTYPSKTRNRPCRTSSTTCGKLTSPRRPAWVPITQARARGTRRR